MSMELIAKILQIGFFTIWMIMVQWLILQNILGTVNYDIVPLPPPNGCPVKAFGCAVGNYPSTCLCEDHCSWEKCVLEEAPNDCLKDVNSKWVWDSKQMFSLALGKTTILF